MLKWSAIKFDMNADRPPWLASGMGKTRDQCTWAPTYDVFTAHDQDRERAPKTTIPNDLVPDVASPEEIKEQLETSPWVPFPEQGVWIACCGRPCVMTWPTFDREDIPTPHFVQEELDHHWQLDGADVFRVHATSPASTGLLDGLKTRFRKPSAVEHYHSLREQARAGIDGVHCLQCYSCKSLYWASHHP